MESYGIIWNLWNHMELYGILGIIWNPWNQEEFRIPRFRVFPLGFYVVEWCKSQGFKIREKSFTEMRVVFTSMYSDMLRNSIEHGTHKELFYLFMDFEILKVA